ncbi:MAG: ATP-binding protein [Candidatus Cloacimonadaceae bacterium]
MKRLKFKAGESIITEDEYADVLFYICKGKVEIQKNLSSMEMPYARLTVLEPGEFFGEMAVIDNEPRSASVRAVEDLELLAIPKDIFMQMSFKHPQIMLNLMRSLSVRLRETNVRFVELMDEMLKKNRIMAIGMAASKIIHDIKTPLTVIVLTAQLIENLYPDGGEYCQNIVKQVRLVDQMVREILEFARGEESTPLIQKINLDNFLDEIYKMHEGIFKGRNVSFAIDNKIKEHVYFDDNKIRRVLMNLIKNASEALPGEGEIRVVTNLASNWLQISVIDNGPGVPEHIRPDLFNPFVTEGKSNGTGLGLPICKKLVSEHKGRLEYMHQESGGSRFDIRLPQSL